MHYLRILFLISGFFATLVGVSLDARIIDAATYTRQLAGSTVQKIYLFSVDNSHLCVDAHTQNMTGALQQLGENSFCLIQSHKARVGSYRNTLDTCKKYKNMTSLGEMKLDKFYEDVAFERLKKYQDEPFTEYYKAAIDIQEKFFKANFRYGDVCDATLSHMHAFQGQFDLDGTKVSGNQLLKHFATQRLSIEILHALYTTNKEHVVICAEAEAIKRVIKQLDKANGVYTKVDVPFNNQPNNQRQRAGIPQPINADEYIGCAASLIAQSHPPIRLVSKEAMVPVLKKEPVQEELIKTSSDQPQLQSTSRSKYLMAAFFGVSAVAAVVCYRNAISSIVSSIWQSLFGSLQSSQPASAPQRFA
jgi:hypothetical protein